MSSPQFFFPALILGLVGIPLGFSGRPIVIPQEVRISQVVAVSLSLDQQRSPQRWNLRVVGLNEGLKKEVQLSLENSSQSSEREMFKECEKYALMAKTQGSSFSLSAPSESIHQDKEGETEVMAVTFPSSYLTCSLK